jgi:hypothetical protein
LRSGVVWPPKSPGHRSPVENAWNTMPGAWMVMDGRGRRLVALQVCSHDVNTGPSVLPSSLRAIADSALARDGI